MRSLRLDIDFGLSQLVVSHLTIDDLKASLLARNGVLKLDEFGGKLYQGGFTANATLDARSDTPSWNLASSVTDVQALPLLQDLADMDLLAGGANLELKLNSRGNRLSTLRENADGQVRWLRARSTVPWPSSFMPAREATSWVLFRVLPLMTRVPFMSLNGVVLPQSVVVSDSWLTRAMPWQAMWVRFMRRNSPWARLKRT